VKRYSSLSAGFRLALRDLEIRGSGNLLGAAQSGHITAIGFSLYCQFLKRTIERLKGRPLPPIVEVAVQLDFLSLSPSSGEPAGLACLPDTFIEDEGQRIAAYRKLAGAARAEDTAALREEFADRFGPLPPPVERLLGIAEIRIAAMARGIRHVETRDGKVILKRGGEFLMRGQRFPRLSGRTPDERLQALLELVRSADEWRGRSRAPGATRAGARQMSD